MACGCPLKVSDIPAHWEFLDNTTAAIVPLEKGAFVRAVSGAVSGSAESATRAFNAKRRICEHTSVNAAAEYDHAYRDAIYTHAGAK